MGNSSMGALDPNGETNQLIVGQAEVVLRLPLGADAADGALLDDGGAARVELGQLAQEGQRPLGRPLAQHLAGRLLQTSHHATRTAAQRMVPKRCRKTVGSR